MNGFIKLKIHYVLVSIALCTLLINVMSLAVPIFTLQIYDRILVHQSMETLIVLMVCAGLAIITEVFLRLSRKHIVLRLCKRILLDKSKCMTRKLININQDQFNYSAIEKLNLFKDYVSVIDYKYNQKYVSFIDVSFIFVHVGVIYIIAKPLALVSITVISIFAVSLVILNNNIKSKIIEKAESESNKFQHLNEIINKYRFIRSNSLTDYFKNRQNHLQRKASMANYRMTFLSMFITNISTLTPQLNIILMTSFGAFLVINNTISLGTLIACVIISGRLTFPLNQIVGIWLRKNEYIQAKKNIDRFENIPVDIPDKLIESQKGGVKLKNIVFNGSDLNKKYVNLELKRGNSVAFISGAKQDLDSLINVLIGAQKPLAGTVEVCGVEPGNIDFEHFPSYIGYISQYSKVVTGTVFENLTSFTDVKLEHVYEVCKFVGIHEKIAQLPHGYNTFIKNVQGEIVSDGLKHQICIARILMHNPKVVIYKHENIYFDDETYNNIIKMIEQLKEKTSLILVTSDPVIAAIADKRYALESTLIKLAENNKYQFHSQVKQISRILKAHG